MARKASGKYAYGYCDRTGFRYPINDLVTETVQGKPTGVRVGKDVHDGDHPQNWLGRLNIGFPDPQVLRNPRPDLSLDESRRMSSWFPVGVGGLLMQSGIGQVTIT